MYLRVCVVAIYIILRSQHTGHEAPPKDGYRVNPRYIQESSP